MKNLFKKAVSLTIAASTVAALSVSAFAATATYYAEETTVDEVKYAAESVVLEDYAAVSGATQYAVAVVPEGFAGGDTDIYYVNQYDAATIVGVINMLLKEGLEDGNYEVRIGNNAAGTTTYDTVAFTVKSTPAGKEVTLAYGDVNGDTYVNLADASLVIQKDASKIEKFLMGEDEIPQTIGDVNGDTYVNLADASLIIQKDAGKVEKFVDSEGNDLDTYTFMVPAK